MILKTCMNTCDK